MRFPSQLATSLGARFAATGSNALSGLRVRHTIVSHICSFVSNLYHLSLGAEAGNSGLDVMHHLTLTTSLIPDLFLRYIDSLLSSSATLKLSAASDANDSDEMREAVSTLVRTLQVLNLLCFRISSAQQPALNALARRNTTNPLFRLLTLAPALCARVPALCVLSTLLSINTNSFVVASDAKTEQVYVYRYALQRRETDRVN